MMNAKAADKVIKNEAAVQDWVRVHKTDWMFNTTECNWDPITIKLTTLCNNNKTLPLRMSLFCYQNSGEH